MICIRKQQRGFTLFELLVASLVFGIVSYMAYSGLMQIMNAREHTGKVEQQLADIQLAFLQLHRDIEHVVRRPVHDAYGTVEGEVSGDELANYRLKLTRGGRQIPQRIPRSNLQRVGYLLEDDQLFRVTWPVLDQAQDTQPRRRRLLDNVENVEVRFLNTTGEWETSWDSAASPLNQPGSTSVMGLPRAIAMKITLKDFGQINRLFLLTES